MISQNGRRTRPVNVRITTSKPRKTTLRVYLFMPRYQAFPGISARKLPNRLSADAKVPALCLNQGLGTSLRKLPVGAECGREGGVNFRVWAPLRTRVCAVLESGPGSPANIVLEPDPDDTGYHAGFSAQASAGTIYRYELDDDPMRYPDPASRYQPDGPHGPSQVIDPRTFAWTDQEWRGATREGQIIYEMHIGTFSKEGTWRGAQRELAELAEVGITLIEVMPVADFPGRFGWGYDGVDLFAPTWLYGEPDDMRSFVNEAHAQGLASFWMSSITTWAPTATISAPSRHGISARSIRPIGAKRSTLTGNTRRRCGSSITANAHYWIDEFHLDGLRLDATQEIFDDSPTHILRRHCAVPRAVPRGTAALILIAENESQQTMLVRPDDSRRLRPGRAMERRFSSQRDGSPHRPQ